jgi:hypothetical protein
MTEHCRSGPAAPRRITQSFVSRNVPRSDGGGKIGLEKVEYELRDGGCLLFRHEMAEIRLTKEHPVAVRPVSRR